MPARGQVAERDACSGLVVLAGAARARVGRLGVDKFVQKLAPWVLAQPVAGPGVRSKACHSLRRKLGSWRCGTRESRRPHLIFQMGKLRQGGVMARGLPVN